MIAVRVEPAGGCVIREDVRHAAGIKRPDDRLAVRIDLTDPAVARGDEDMAAQGFDRDAARAADPYRCKQLAGVGIEHGDATRAGCDDTPPLASIVSAAKGPRIASGWGNPIGKNGMRSPSARYSGRS